MALPFGVGAKRLAAPAGPVALALTSGARGCYRSVTIPRYRSVTSQSRAMAKKDPKRHERGDGAPQEPPRTAERPRERIVACAPGSLPPPRHPRRRRRNDRRGGRHQQDDALPPFRLEGRSDPRVSELQGAKGRRDLGEHRSRESRRSGRPALRLYRTGGEIHRRGRARLRSGERRGRADRGRAIPG